MTRLDQNAFDVEDFDVLNSKVDNNRLQERQAKDDFMRISNDSVDDFRISRRKRLLELSGEEQFNKLSDEMILMILRFLPKNSLVTYIRNNQCNACRMCPNIDLQNF